MTGREGYSYHAVVKKHVYLRRSAPNELTELVMVDADGSVIAVQLTMDQLRLLCRDFNAHYFSNK